MGRTTSREVTNRPGRDQFTTRELGRRRYRANRKSDGKSRPEPKCCPWCNSKMIKDDDWGYVCVLCRSRDYREKHGNECGDPGGFLSYTSEDGEHILVTPLGAFSLELEKSDAVEGPVVEESDAMEELGVVDEDVCMPMYFQPGSLAKLKAMADRCAKGFSVFHSEDVGTWSRQEHSGQAALNDTVEQQRTLNKDNETADKLEVWTGGRKPKRSR